MPLPDSFLQELKSRCDITDVVSSYVTLKRRGRNYIGLCPFHNEKRRRSIFIPKTVLSTVSAVMWAAM